MPVAIYEPGDIFLTRGNSIISKLIRVFSRTGGESRTMVNHCGLVVDDGNSVSAVIVEASSKVIRRRFNAYRRSSSTQVAVYRPLNVTPEQIATIVAYAESTVGKPYGYHVIVLHWLDWLLNGRYVFRRLTTEHYPICSSVVAEAYSAAGLTFGVAANAASPDDVWDYVTTSDNYKAVHHLGELP